MPLSIATLLMHDEEVPAPARSALKAAYAAPHARRGEMLERAARVLGEMTGLDRCDVRELVGLPCDGARA